MAERLGSDRRASSIRAPSPSPTSRSLRYSPAQATRPGSTSRSNVASIFETLPAELMTTISTTRGCSSSTSTWRIVAVLIDGAETTASRLVICESVSVVARIASSISRRTSVSSSRRGAAGSALLGAEQPVDDVAVARRRSARARPRRAGGRAARAPRGRRARCGPSRDRSRASGSAAIDARGHRLAGVQVLLYDLAEDALLAGGEHRPDCRPGAGAPAAPERR